jgi:hypothetical protein
VNEREVAEAVRDWARDVVPDLVAGYAYPVAQKLGGLPDVAAVVTEARVVPSDAAFPFSQLQQVWLRVFDVEASVMVPIADAEDYEGREAAHETAHQQLQSIGSTLRDGAIEDATLGDRVPMTSPLIRTGYEPPFDPAEDATEGRCVYLFLTVAEPIPEPG